MIEWVEKELDSWGRAVRGPAAGLGFKSETLEYKMMKYGPDGLTGGNRTSLIPGSFMNSSAERTERIVLAMPPELRALAIIVYANNYTRERQAEALSKKLGLEKEISRRKLMEMLGNLHHRYEAYSDAMFSVEKGFASSLTKTC